MTLIHNIYWVIYLGYFRSLVPHYFPHIISLHYTELRYRGWKRLTQSYPRSCGWLHRPDSKTIGLVPCNHVSASVTILLLNSSTTYVLLPGPEWVVSAAHSCIFCVVRSEILCGPPRLSRMFDWPNWTCTIPSHTRCHACHVDWLNTGRANRLFAWHTKSTVIIITVCFINGSSITNAVGFFPHRTVYRTWNSFSLISYI